MKVTHALLAAAASIGPVSATFHWRDAPGFGTPDNQDNKCIDGQRKGWDWSRLGHGKFDNYDGFEFGGGWSCKDDNQKRDLETRTWNRVISGSCGSEPQEAPSFGCGSKTDVDKFSVKSFHLRTEFDCRMEFHYDMPDGSSCKESHDCSSKGTTIHNKQCGGAKRVRFVYPKQDKPKERCGIDIGHIDFDCDKPKTPCKKCGDKTTTAPIPSETCTGEHCDCTPGVDCPETTVPGECTPGVDCPEETSTTPGDCYGPDCGTTTASESQPTETQPGDCEGEDCECTPGVDCPEKTTTPGDCYGDDCEGKTTPAVPTQTSPGDCEGDDCECTPGVDCPEETSTTPGDCEGDDCGATTASESQPTETQPGDCEGDDCEGKTTAVPSETQPGDCYGDDCEGKTTSAIPSETQPGDCEGEDCDATSTASDSEPTEPAETQPEETEPAETTDIVITTTFDSTSTVYTTEIETITSCGPEVPDCPADNTPGTPIIVTKTIALSTTICPVTETRTQGVSSPVETETQSDDLPTGGDKTESAPTGDKSEPASTGDKTEPVPTGGDKTESAPTGDKTETDSSADSVPTSTAGDATTEPVEETTYVTTFDSTSTIYTTNIETITSCGPEVTDCPADATSGQEVVVTKTIAISTTICPVTETRTEASTKPAEGGDKPSGTSPVTESGSSPEEPKETLPCPDVVPSCLNTFLHLVEDCEDNTDAKCYCPSKDFVDSVFQCLYSHGKSDDVIAEAVSFFQGICAPYVGENPDIATGADSITSIITVTGTPTVTSAHYTTVVVEVTVTEPCVTDGTTVEGSSTVRTVSTEVTVPEVGFHTGPSGGVDVVPPTAPATAPAPGETNGDESPESPDTPETLITTAPTAGTGGIYPTPTPSAPEQVPVTGGAGRTGLGFAAILGAVALAL